MPGGGRGTILGIANSLNDKTQTKEAVKCWITGGYEVEASVETLAAAFKVCDYEEDLQEIWSHAVSLNRVLEIDY